MRITRSHPVGTALPKTRPGKIMRRILRKIAGLHDADANHVALQLGDARNSANLSVVGALLTRANTLWGCAPNQADRSR